MVKKEREGHDNPINNNRTSELKKVSYEDLPAIIKHLSENKVINLIPLKPGSKLPALSSWKKYQNTQYPLSRLRKHKGNFGIITGDPLGYGVDYLTILDIDDKKGESGVYQYFKELDTLQVKTASKGYHIYLWSSKKITDKDYLSNLFDVDIELRGTAKGLIVSAPSFVKYEDGKTGSHQIIKTGSKYPILNVEDAEEFIKDILIKNGLKAKKGIQHIQSEPITVKVNHGIWKRELNQDEITDLVELLKPLYNQGNRHNLVLYLSGWMYKAEIGYKSALKVIQELSQKDEEEKGRLITLKNSYRGIETNGLKGSSGVYNLLETRYNVIDNDKERDKKIKEEYGKIAKIIVHPLSSLGIRRSLKEEKVYSDSALRNLTKFIKQRYAPIVDEITHEVYIYDYEQGLYKEYNELKFLKWIDELFPEHEFFLKDINKVRTAISNLKDEDSDYLWFKNGLLNTKTLEFEDHTPEVFTKRIIPYSYNSEAQSELMETKLKEILIDEKGPNEGDNKKYNFFLEFMGYCFLADNPFHMMVFITGSGGNGKSVLSSLIFNIFGPMVSSVPLHDFYTPFGKMGLIGKSVNVVYDLPKKMLKDTGDLKAVTGEDYMTIQIKNKNPWTGKLGIKILGMGNHLPKVTDASNGFWQRVAHFETRNTFRTNGNEDKDLKEKLKNDTEGMEWLIYNSIQVYKQGPHVKGRSGWSLPIGTDKTKKEYLRLSNPCYYGALELFEKSNDKKDMVLREDVVTDITRLLRKEGLEIPANNTPFYQAIRSIGGEDFETSEMVNGKKKSLRGFRMVRFKDPEKNLEKEAMKLDNELKLEINQSKLSEIGAKNLNPVQKMIIEELSGFGLNKCGEIVETLLIESKYQDDEIKREMIDLIDKEVINGGKGDN